MAALTHEAQVPCSKYKNRKTQVFNNCSNKYILGEGKSQLTGEGGKMAGHDPKQNKEKTILEFEVNQENYQAIFFLWGI